jgi:UDP-glucose 4-epimerase
LYNSALITGGAGFIGSHLCERLLDDGMSVTIIDDLSTGALENIAHLENDPKFRGIVASADERELLDREVARHGIVFHLASAVGVRTILDHPVRTLESIVLSTDIVIRACARYRRPVVLTSTSEVYGKAATVPFQEESDVVMGATSKRRWAYACAKALDEFMALAHFYETSLPVYIVRLFNTVGPRQTGQYGMVLPTFIGQALNGDPITVYGDGNQQRCFCSVSDVVDGLCRLPMVAEAKGKVVNLGSTEETSIVGLAQLVREELGSESEIKFVPYDEAYGPGFDDMERRVPDLARAEQFIGWAPSFTLKENIRMIAREMAS